MKMMNLFFSKEGDKDRLRRHHRNIVSRYLGKPLIPTLDYLDPEIPPISRIEGVDLVTEGVITISKVLNYAEDFLDRRGYAADWTTKKDGASPDRPGAV